MFTKDIEHELGLYGARIVQTDFEDFNSQSQLTFVATSVVDTRVFIYQIFKNTILFLYSLSK